MHDIISERIPNFMSKKALISGALLPLIFSKLLLFPILDSTDFYFLKKGRIRIHNSLFSRIKVNFHEKIEKKEFTHKKISTPHKKELGVQILI